MNWLGFDDLVLDCRADGRGEVVHPHPVQGVQVVREVLRRAGGLVGSHFAGVVCLAVDAMSFEVAAPAWATADAIVPLTSCFPSTSACAWLCSTTGTSSWELGVPGVVWRVPGGDRLYHVFTDCGYADTNDWETPFIVQDPGISQHATIFDDFASGPGWHVLLGDLANLSGRWRDALLHGARTRSRSAIDWNCARQDPALMLQAVELDLQAATDGRDHALVWAMINFDDYVHANGYNEAVKRALAEIDRIAVEYARKGYAVVAYSDHGMTPNECSAELRADWELLTSKRYCTLPPGGAGRVRWLYPKASTEAELEKQLNRLGSGIRCVRKSDLLDELNLHRGSLTRVGELVCFATDRFFPTPPPYSPWEHGSLTRDEMIVPCALWGAGILDEG